MTTKYSPIDLLKAQADKITNVLKAAERGEKIDVKFAKKIKEARNKKVITVGIVMDDKIIKIDIPWTAIRDNNEIQLSTFILNQMLEIRAH